MCEGERRTVGERGEVTIPEELRERLGIEGGDDIVVREDAGKLVIERPVTQEKLAEAYRQCAKQSRELTEELAGVSTEANEHLGDAPEWE